MPSYDQLANEAAWRAEVAAPALAALAARLRARYPGAQVGLRGDNKHLSGYHRSRRWIKESAHCKSRSYSVSRTSGDKSGGDSNWVCAMDLGGLSQSELHAVCKRLDAAVRAGRLEKVTEWYGNFGGDSRVDGFDNISNRLAASDDSHLWHLHMSFDRGRAGEDHSDLFAILTGDDDMSWTENLTAGKDAGGKTFPAKDWLIGTNMAAWLALTAVTAQGVLLERLLAASGIDPAELAQLRAAAEAGARAGVTAGAAPLAAAIAAALADELALTPAEAQAAAEAALRKVLGGLGTTASQD